MRTPAEADGRRVVVELAHELVGGEALAREPLLAPEGRLVDGEDLVDRCPARAPAPAAWRQAGSAGRKRIEVVRFGGTATIAAARLGDRPSASTSTAVVDQRISRTGALERHAIAQPLGEPQRDQLRAADDAVGQALFRLEQLVGAARPGDHPQPLEQREGVGRLRQEAAGEPRAQQVARHLVGDLLPQPRLEGDARRAARRRGAPRAPRGRSPWRASRAWIQPPRRRCSEPSPSGASCPS